MPQTTEIATAIESIPAQTHRLKLSVAGGWWEDGTTLSSRDGSSWGARDMNLQWQATSAEDDMIGIWIVRTFHDSRECCEVAVVVAEQDPMISLE